MANPTGENQQPYTLQPAYGDVKKQTQLLREAPISGSPLAAQALNAPRRAGNEAKRGSQPQQQEQPSTPPAPTAQASSSLAWQQIATVPGISPLVQSYAMEAQAHGS